MSSKIHPAAHKRLHKRAREPSPIEVYLSYFSRTRTAPPPSIISYPLWVIVVVAYYKSLGHREFEGVGVGGRGSNCEYSNSGKGIAGSTHERVSHNFRAPYSHSRSLVRVLSHLKNTKPRPILTVADYRNGSSLSGLEKE
jgi:hypothetical protein